MHASFPRACGVLDNFRYRTWMNAVLRAYVMEQKRKQGPGKP